VDSSIDQLPLIGMMVRLRPDTIDGDGCVVVRGGSCLLFVLKDGRPVRLLDNMALIAICSRNFRQRSPSPPQAAMVIVCIELISGDTEYLLSGVLLILRFSLYAGMMHSCVNPHPVQDQLRLAPSSFAL